MDLSIAKSIYEHAKVVKNNKVVSDAERVIEEYSVFQRDNPSLPYIAPFCGLDHTGPLIKILTQHGEDKIDTIIKVFEHIFCSNEDLIIAKAPVRSSHLKNPTTIKTPINKEPIHRMKQQNLERTQELTLFLDSILKETKFMETEWLEFKRFNSRPDLDNFGKILAGLANTAFINNVAFAYLIIGIDDLKAEICGTKIKTVSEGWKSFEKKLRQSFQPSLEFEVDEFDYKNDPQKHIVIIKIHAASDKPVAYCGESFIRHGDITVPLTDFPNYQNIFLNSTQQTVIDNSITIIIQNPQIIFNIKIENSNIGSNIKDNHGTEINIATSQNKTSFIRWLIGVLFSGAGIFLLQQCFFSNDNKVSIKEEKPTTQPIESSNSLEQISQDITINQENFNTTTSIYEKKSQYYADSSDTEGKKDVINSLSSTSQPILKDKSISSISVKKIKLSLDERYTVCSLYKGADTISTGSSYAKGLLISLISDYNDFAQSNGLKTFDNNPDNYGYSGFLDETGVAVLSSIKRSLENIIKSNKIRCK